MQIEAMTYNTITGKNIVPRVGIEPAALWYILY